MQGHSTILMCLKRHQRPLYTLISGPADALFYSNEYRACALILHKMSYSQDLSKVFDFSWHRRERRTSLRQGLFIRLVLKPDHLYNMHLSSKTQEPFDLGPLKGLTSVQFVSQRPAAWDLIQNAQMRTRKRKRPRCLNRCLASTLAMLCVVHERALHHFPAKRWFPREIRVISSSP